MFSNCMGRRFDLITLFGDGEGSVWSQRYGKGGSQKCGKARRRAERVGSEGEQPELRARGAICQLRDPDKSLFLFTLQLSHL